MNALEAYRSILKELDKHESPTFSVDDFNWWFPSAIDQYITENYEDGDIYQKDLDDISILVKDAVALTQDTDKSLFSKPADYRHLLYLNVVAKALSNYRRWSKDAQETFVIRRQRTGRRGYQEDNAYGQPSEDNPQYRISNEKIKVLLGTNFEPVSASLMYVSVPNTVYLNPDSSVDFDLEINNSTLQFSTYVCKEVIRVCARIIIENIESGRYQTVLKEQQMRQE